MIADSFGSLTEFCIRSSWSELVHQHNDPAIDYHVPLYEYVVIVYEPIAELDVVRINGLRCGCLPTRSAPSLLDGFFSSVQTSQVIFVADAWTFSSSRPPQLKVKSL